MTIKILKMVNGEEIITKKVSNICSKARSVRMINDPQKGPSLALVPFFILDPDCEFKINENNVVGEINAPSEVEKTYLQETSGIQLA